MKQMSADLFVNIWSIQALGLPFDSMRCACVMVWSNSIFLPHMDFELRSVFPSGATVEKKEEACVRV